MKPFRYLLSSAPILAGAAAILSSTQLPSVDAAKTKVISPAAAAVEAKRQRAARHAAASVHRNRAPLEQSLVEVLTALEHHNHGRGTPLDKAELKKVQGRAAELERKLRDKPYVLSDADMADIHRRARGASAKSFAQSQPAGHYEKLLTKAHAEIVSHETGRKTLSQQELTRLHEKRRDTSTSCGGSTDMATRRSVSCIGGAIARVPPITRIWVRMVMVVMMMVNCSKE